MDTGTSDDENKPVSTSSQEPRHVEPTLQERSSLSVVISNTVTPVSTGNSSYESIYFPCSAPWCVCSAFWRFGPFILTVAICLVMFLGFTKRPEVWAWLEHLPWCLSLLLFIFMFTIVSFPFSFGYIILNMMCGYLYGFMRGQLTVMIAVSIGFSLAFFLCRNLFKDYARNMVISSSSTIHAILQVIEGPNAFKVIFLTRLTPIPFGLQTVLFAITQVSFSQCLLSSTLGLLPLQVLNTYMGSTLRNMQDVLTDRLDSYFIFSGQVLSSVFLMAFLLRQARKELAKHTQQGDVEPGNVSR